MKKQILSATLALAALAVSANQFDYGYTNPKLVGNAGAYTQRPVTLDSPTSGAQTLYTYEELHDLLKVGADGSVTKASISEITFLLTGGTENYFSGASFDVTVYAENTEATSFPLNNAGKPVYFDYSKAVSGHVTVDGDYSDEWNDFLEWGGYETYETGLPVTIKLSEPIVYEGASLLLTWLCEANGTEDLFYNGDCYGVNPKNGVKMLFNKDNNLTGTADDTHTYLPAVLFTYDEVVQGPSAPEIVYGDPADFTVGNFDDPYVVNGSTADFMPFDGAYAHSGSQALYTTVELSGLNKINDGEVSKAEIQDITFLVSAEDGMYFFGGEYFETTVYVQNTDAVEFEKDAAGKIKWFDYSTEYKGSVTIDFTEEEWEAFSWGEGGLYPVTIHLDTPVMYEGNSLLFTFVTESECGDETWVNATAAVKTGGVQGANMASDRETFADSYAAGYPKNTWSHVPVLKLHYVPVTEKGGATVTPVTFENVSVGLVESNLKVGATAKANVIAVSFDINDPSNCGAYEIKVGTTSVGTVKSTSATVAYLGIPAAGAVTLNVVPVGEGTIGVPYEISKADIEALFPAPEMEVAATACGDFSYSLTKLPESVKTDGAAQFFFTNYEAAPVSQFNWLDIMNPVDKNVYLLRDASDAMADLMVDYPADYKNVQLNKGRIAFSKTDAVTASIDARTAAVTGLSGYLYLTLAIDYPLYYSTVPSLAEGGKVAVADNIGVVTVQRKYDNGNAYASNQLRAELNDVTNPGVARAEHPESIYWEESADKKTITVVGPESTALHYQKVDVAAAEALDAVDPFTKHENELPYMVVDKKDYLGSIINVQARKADGTVHSEISLLVGDTVTGVSDITADSAAEAEYYTLQGARVAGTPAPGLYLCRQAGVVAKVLVK